MNVRKEVAGAPRHLARNRPGVGDQSEMKGNGSTAVKAFCKFLQIQAFFLQAFPRILLAVLSEFKALQVRKARLDFLQISVLSPPPGQASAKGARDALHRFRIAEYHHFRFSKIPAIGFFNGGALLHRRLRS